MTAHIGVEPEYGRLSYYDDADKSTVDIFIKKVAANEIEKSDSMFEEIKSVINGKQLGFACICLMDNYGNKIRKRFIDSGIKSGFKNVEIINLLSASTLYALSQLSLKPNNGDVIWIKGGHFYVWQMINGKAKYINFWSANILKSNELKKIVTESKPDIVLYEKGFDKAVFNEISQACQFFRYTCIEYSGPRAALLKARMKFGDQGLSHLGVLNLSSREITLKANGKIIVSFGFSHQLPIKYFHELLPKPKDNMLKIMFNKRNAEILNLPNYDQICFTFYMDTNEIYNVVFEETLDGKIHKRVNNDFAMDTTDSTSDSIVLNGTIKNEIDFQMAQESKGEKAVASILGQFRLIKYYRPHSVYAIVDKDGKHKYIGRTNDIDLRMNAHERKSVNPELQVWIKENVHSSKILFTGKADDCARVEALLLHFYFNNKLDNLQLFNKRQEHRQLLINEQYIKVDEDIEIFL